MENKEVKAVLNYDELQIKANEYAQKGAIECIKDFYTGYNSPYKKAIEESLQDKGLSVHLELPDIIGLLNEGISQEVDKIANQAVAKSFIPLVKRLITRIDGEVKLSEIFKEFIDKKEIKYYDNYTASVEKDRSYSWYNVNLKFEGNDYRLTLHSDYQSEKEGNPKYKILSLPYNYNSSSKKMKLSLDGVTLELPFTPNVLEDDFLSYVARLVMSQTLIEIDCDGFDDDMFEDNDD